MSCKHEKIKSVNCEIFCLFCGEKLPLDYMVAKERIAAQKSTEKPVVDIQQNDNPFVPETPAEPPEKFVPAALPDDDPVADVPAAIPAAEILAAVNGENSVENGDTPAAKPAKKERKPREAKGGKK